jgi:nucleotide-binding universal stress UspA family protein
MTTTGGTSTAGTTAVSAGQRPGEVVVGDDGTWHSRAALHHAADEAVRRGLPLTVLTITSAADQTVAPVSDAVQALRTRTPGLTVTAAAIINDGTEHLPESLAGCELLVLGNRGRRGATGG